MSTKTLRRNNRGGGRPPWDPSAAIRPKNVLEKQAMQSLEFRTKVQNANANSICNANSEYVGRMSLRRLLIMDTFCVPVFQRRYCWTKVQWRTLFEDAENSSVGKQHSLGRLTCTETNNKNNNSKSEKKNKTLVGVPGRSCILDGQQRFTTVTILLAAIRDQLQKLQGDGNGFAGTIDSINSILFCDLPQMKEWINQPQQTLNEGIELPFARLVPTFCDRLAYYQSILPTGSVVASIDTTTSSLLPRPLQAKYFFDQALGDGQKYDTLPKILNLLKRVLDGLSMLYFPVDTNTNQQDGTDDLMVIYERLALRDATFCKPKRDQEYRGMDGSDLIRNLLLGSFSNETDALDYYNQFWLPLEQQVSVSEDEGNSGSGMTKVLQAFLDAQKQQGRGGADDNDDDDDDNNEIVQSGIIGGQIYAEFQVWFASRLATSKVMDETSSGGGGGGGVSIEKKVQQVGKDLLAFARANTQS